MRRVIGIDIHRTFGEVVIWEEGRLRNAGRVDMTRTALEGFGKRLRSTDEVVIEATGNCMAVSRVLSPFVARVVIANPLQVKAIAHAHVKTDKIDAGTLASLFAAGYLPEIWTPDAATERMRRLAARRFQIVRHRTRRDLFEGAPHSIEPGGKKGNLGRLIGRTKGGMNTKLHAVTDANGRPLSFFMTAGQISDYIGAAALIDELPRAQWLLADRGYDADWFRDALEEKGIKPCIPGRKSRNEPIKYDKRRYRRRNRIEIMFGRLKDWRRVATRYDRCPTVFLSAIALAATVIFWL